MYLDRSCKCSLHIDNDHSPNQWSHIFSWKKKFKSKCDLCMFNKYEQKLKYPMSKFTLNNASKFSLKKKKLKIYTNRCKAK